MYTSMCYVTILFIILQCSLDLEISVPLLLLRNNTSFEVLYNGTRLLLITYHVQRIPEGATSSDAMLVALYLSDGTANV